MPQFKPRYNKTITKEMEKGARRAKREEYLRFIDNLVKIISNETKGYTPLDKFK